MQPSCITKGGQFEKASVSFGTLKPYTWFEISGLGKWLYVHDMDIKCIGISCTIKSTKKNDKNDYKY